MKAVGVIINLGFLAALGYATYYFARPAVVEVWRHGYGSGLTRGAKPDLNLFVGMFLSGMDANAPVDLARARFNVFLRYVTFTILLLLGFTLPGAAAETLTRERARETWTSLLATPLVAREILRSTFLAVVWRLRGLIEIIVVLWTIGLIAGAVHPIGYLLAMLNFAASTWLFAVWGVRASTGSKDQAEATGKSINLAFLSLLFLALPALLPNRFNSVLFIAGSHPFVSCLSLASYRDVRAALAHESYPLLEWIGLHTGEGSLWVIATCLIGIIVPTLGGWWAWRNAVAHFDRLVGRPWRRARGPQSVGLIGAHD